MQVHESALCPLRIEGAPPLDEVRRHTPDAIFHSLDDADSSQRSESTYLRPHEGLRVALVRTGVNKIFIRSIDPALRNSGDDAVRRPCVGAGSYLAPCPLGAVRRTSTQRDRG